MPRGTEAQRPQQGRDMVTFAAQGRDGSYGLLSPAVCQAPSSMPAVSNSLVCLFSLSFSLPLSPFLPFSVSLKLNGIQLLAPCVFSS